MAEFLFGNHQDVSGGAPGCTTFGPNPDPEGGVRIFQCDQPVSASSLLGIAAYFLALVCFCRTFDALALRGVETKGGAKIFKPAGAAAERLAQLHSSTAKLTVGEFLVISDFLTGESL